MLVKPLNGDGAFEHDHYEHPIIMFMKSSERHPATINQRLDSDLSSWSVKNADHAGTPRWFPGA